MSEPIKVGRRLLSAEEYQQYTIERLLGGSTRSENSGCLIWQRSIMKNGYGQIGYLSKVELVHRVAYKVWIGQLANDLHVDHVRSRGCTSRACIEPTHLEAVTQVENNRRIGVLTHCRRGGHPLSGENLYMNPTAGRVCRTCRLEKERDRRAPTAGNIGDDQHEVEFEPIYEPASVPEIAPPIEVPEPEPVPA